MKVVVYGPGRRVGLLDGDQILDVAAAAKVHDMADEDALSSLLDLIDAGQRGLDLLHEVAERSADAGQPEVFRPLGSVDLQAPFPGRRMLLAGSNNADHVANAYNNMGSPTTREEVHDKARLGQPAAFWAVARPVMGPGADIQVPARAGGFFDYEGEPGIVLGKLGKDISAEDIDKYIWGVTLVIDWSVRDEAWPPRPQSPLVFAKNFDCSKSIGPCIVVGEVDAHDLPVETLVNGERRQAFSSADMIFSFGEVLQYVSDDFTFYPGDVVSLGTGAGTGIDSTVPNEDRSWPKDRFLKPGDTVEVRSEGIGSLVGHIVPKEYKE